MVNQALLPDQVKRGVERVYYAKRLETRMIKEQDFPYSTEKPLNSPEEVANFARSIQNSDVEKMIILYLNTKNFLNCIQITAGTINKNVIWTREIIKYAILSGSTGIVLVHNHPSGDPESSPDDRAMTKTIKDAAALFDISVLDHIILGAEGKYLSFQERGIMP